MKRRSIAFYLFLLHACFAVALAFAEQADGKMNFDSDHSTFTRVFTNSELGGVASGACFGRNYACVYSNESYLLMNETGAILYQHTIDHPSIKKDAAYINDAMYCDDTLWLLVFDHSVEQSYIIRQTKMEHPQYGKMISKQLRSFSIAENDIFLVGADENLMPWCGRMTPDGKILWEHRPKADKCVYQHCIVSAEKMYIVESSQDTAELFISIRDTEGTLLASRKIKLVYSPQSKKGAHLNVLNMDVFSKGIIICGQQLSNSDEHGFYVVVDEVLDPICSKIYEDYRLILSGSSVKDRYMMLAVVKEDAVLTNARYIISMDESYMIPLEEYDSMYLSLGLASSFDEGLYVFGSIFHSDNLSAPSAFLSEINLQ